VTTLSLVVPLYNEETRVVEHLEALTGFVSQFAPGSELLFVDDGSIDNTVSTVEKALVGGGHGSARVVRRPHAGKGAAVRAGLLESRCEIAAFCDVDLATPLTDLRRVIAAASEIDGLAIASRALADSTLTRRERATRELLGRLYNGLLRLTVVRGIQDTQCGAKAASTEHWQKLLDRSREVGFAWDAEIVAIAQRTGIPVREVAIEWKHDDRSRVRVLRDGLGMVAAVPRILWRSRRW
jgi:glycosyltransferase involved in cell wall biosynthesis